MHKVSKIERDLRWEKIRSNVGLFLIKGIKWLSLLLVSMALYGSPQKIVIFDYGGVIADANYHSLVDFLSKTIGVATPPLQQSRLSFKESLNKPASYWEDYTGRPLCESWIQNFENKQRLLSIPIPGMQELILALKDLGIQVALLSNTTHARSDFLRSQGAYSPFHPVLLSCDLGIRKPQKRIYEILLNTLNVSPEDCLFVDDKFRNIQAAKELGIDGIIFHSSEQLKEELLKRGIAL